MGGGQANSAQAAQAAAQQTAASNQDMAISKQNSDLQRRMVDTLFGSGSPGSTGSLTGMLDPKSLNTGAPTGAYKTQWNTAQDQIGRDYANERGSIAQQFANMGATSRSTPTGFQADQMNKLARGEADTRGSTYTNLVGQQHQDALNDFWNANNIASGNAASSGSTATNAAGNSGSSSAALYGTAGQYHAPTTLNSAIGAAGTVGGAAAGKPPKPPCWIAEAIYGIDDPRTLLLRRWLITEFTKQRIGWIVVRIYVAIGQQTAWAVRRSWVLRALFTPLFESALRSARAWEATC
jgi:hypothetical protein